MLPIVMIEDDVNDIALALRVLKNSNLLNPVICCQTAEDALTYLQESDGNAALILLDLKLKPGGLDGFDFIREFNQLRPINGWRAIPIIVLTGDEDSRERADALGVQKYFTKPVDAMKLWMATQVMQLGWSILGNQ